MKICIRADGGSEIGMGHIVRMTALAKELRKNNDVFFACRVDIPLSKRYLPGIDFVKNNNFEVIEIDENNLKTDIIKINADCIITDSYDVDEEYFDILKDNFEFVGYVDNKRRCEFFNVDFIINQNFYAKDIKYKTAKATKMILGSKFIMLREQFRFGISKKKIQEDIKDVMVTVGGSDNKCLTKRIIDELKDCNYTLHIVVGSGFNNINKLKEYQCEKIKLYFNADMKALMEECDLCIAACGSTIYELSVCGTPFIAICIAENQEMMFQFIKENKLSGTSVIGELKKEIESFTYDKRKAVSEKLTTLVDGKGIERLSYEINEILKVK